MALITTANAAQKLGIHQTRVQVLIREGRLPAQMIGGTYVIEESDLALVSDRPVGRPKKDPNDDALPKCSEYDREPSAGILPETPATRTAAQKRAIAAEQRRRWKGEPLPKVSSKKSPPAVKAKATKKGGKK